MYVCVRASKSHVCILYIFSFDLQCLQICRNVSRSKTGIDILCKLHCSGTGYILCVFFLIHPSVN